MNERIKELRKALTLNQVDFGAKIGISNTAVSKWEKGENAVPDSAVLSICREFGVSETWLRTGEGEIFVSTSREEEMAKLLKELMTDSPDSFRSALLTTLLRFRPDGPEWAILEEMCRSLEEEWREKKKDHEP